MWRTGSFTASRPQAGPGGFGHQLCHRQSGEQLGVSLFAAPAPHGHTTDRCGARRSFPTAAPWAIALDGLLAKARGLTAGLEAEVSLVVDVMLPAKSWSGHWDEFSKKFPTIALRLHVEALGAVDPGGAREAGALASAARWRWQRPVDPLPRRNRSKLLAVLRRSSSALMQRPGQRRDGARSNIPCPDRTAPHSPKGVLRRGVGEKWRWPDLGANMPCCWRAGLGQQPSDDQEDLSADGWWH